MKVDTLAEKVELIGKLSSRRQEIVRPMFDRPRDFVLLSIRASAERLGTDPAFLLRVVQQLGFATYSDFKSFLQDLSYSTATSFDRFKERAAEKTSLEGMTRASLEACLANVGEVESQLDFTALARMARKLHKAERLFLVAGDLASPVADYFAYQLRMLGLAPVVLHGGGETIYAMHGVRESDAVIGITFRKGLRSTVEALRDSRERGAYCVAITNSRTSGLARFGDDVFLVAIEGYALRSSFVAAMALVDVLVAACAHMRRTPVLKALSETQEEQMNGYRWYKEGEARKI